MNVGRWRGWLGTLSFGANALACGDVGTRERDAASERAAASSVIDVSDPFVLAEPAYRPVRHGSTPVASNGEDSLLLYAYDLADNGGATRLAAVRITEGGVIRDPRGILLDTGGSVSAAPSAVWANDHWLVFYVKDGGTYTVTLTRDGVPGVPRRLGDPLVNLVASWGNDRALVINWDVSLFVDGTGTPIGEPFELLPRDFYQVIRRPVYRDPYWLVPAKSGRNLVVASVGNSGWTGQSGIVRNSRGTLEDPVLTLTNDGFTVNYSGPQPTCDGGGPCNPQTRWCQAMLIASEGAISAQGAWSSCAPPVTASYNALEVPGWQDAPAIAFDGTSYLVAWADAGRRGVIGTRIAPSGERLSDPFTIASGKDPLRIQAASRGEDSFVTWGTEVSTGTLDGGALVGPDDAVTMQAGLTPARLVFSTAVATDGERYLTGWLEFNQQSALVGRAAFLDDPSTVASWGPSGDFDVAFDGETYAVVSYQAPPLGASSASIVATRFSRQFQQIDVVPKVLTTFPAPHFGGRPRVVAGRSGWVAAWAYDEVLGAVALSSQLEPLGPVLTLASGGTLFDHQVHPAFDGEAFWVTWGEASAPQSFTLLARRIGANGELLDASPVEIESARNWTASETTLAAGPSGQLLLVSRSPELGSPLQGRFLQALTPPSSGGSGGSAGTAGFGGGGTGNYGGTAGLSGGGTGNEAGAAGGAPIGGAGGNSEGGASGEGGSDAETAGGAGGNSEGGASGEGGSNTETDGGVAGMAENGGEGTSPSGGRAGGAGGRSGAGAGGGNDAGGRAGAGAGGGNDAGGRAGAGIAGSVNVAGTAGSAGAPGAAGAAGSVSGEVDVGCNCRAAPAPRGASSLWMAALPLLLLRVRRRWQHT